MEPAEMTQEEAMRLVDEGTRMDREGVERLQRERLRFLVRYARKHSPLYREMYAGLPEDPEPSSLPPLLRNVATARFDDWVCDREITKADVEAFLADPASLGEPYRGQYVVMTTSGTTDVPLVLVRDRRHNAVNAALMMKRFAGGAKIGHIKRLTEPGVRTCGVTAGGGHHSSYLSFLRAKRLYEKMGVGDNALMLPVDMSTREKVDILNRFQPEILSGFPSALQILAFAQKEGTLDIHPLVIACSAEHLSAFALDLLEKTFGCPVMNNYCSTEGGEIAMSCPENRMHINADWMIVEPVDADNRPVADGALSDGMLLTNLANLVQPIIRYRVNDRVALHREPCPCGLPFPYLEIEGRKEDILEFDGEAGKVLVSPTALLVAGMHVAGCAGAQFIQRSPADVEIRFECADPARRAEVGRALADKVRELLADNSAANVRVALNDGPLLRGKSGKVRCVCQDFDR